jgi:molybdopterin-binding protein
VKIDVGSIVVSSAITNTAGDELKLKPSQQAYAAIQASDVMTGRRAQKLERLQQGS